MGIGDHQVDAAQPALHHGASLSDVPPTLGTTQARRDKDGAVVAIATLIRYWVDPWLIGAQYPTFFMAAIIATSLGGVCVGLLSVALSALSAWFFILPPQWSFVATNSAEFYGLVAFLLVATLMVIIIGSLQIAYADQNGSSPLGKTD